MYKEIESKIERPWWWWLEAASAWVFKKLWVACLWIFEIFVKQPVLGAWKATGEGLHKMWVALLEQIGKRIGWAIGLVLIILLTMSWTANGYSFGRTFSWDGLVTLWETFK